MIHNLKIEGPLTVKACLLWYHVTSGFGKPVYLHANLADSPMNFSRSENLLEITGFVATVTEAVTSAVPNLFDRQHVYFPVCSGRAIRR